MKNFTLLSAFFAVFMLAAHAVVADEPPYEVFGISVSKPMPSQEGGWIQAGWDEGTTVTLLVRSNDLAIIKVDENASKVKSFTDDKKNNLMKQKGKNASYTSPVSLKNIGDGRKWAVVEFRAPSRPAVGSKAVMIEAEIVLKVGGGSVVEEHKDIPLSGKGKFKIGKGTITVKKEKSSAIPMIGNPFAGPLSGDEEDAKEVKTTSIALKTGASFDDIKTITFLNAKGEEIESQLTGSSWTRMIVNHEERHYMLAEEVETVTIKTDAYEKLETLRIPVSVEVGIGL